MVTRNVRMVAGLLGLAAVIAVALVLIPAGASSILRQTGASGGELVVSPRTLTFGVDATGMLRAASVQNFGAPAEFAGYWQFQLVSQTPEGRNVKAGEVLIGFDAQRVREELQRFENEMDQAAKELEKTRAQIDLEGQDLMAKLSAAENKFDKLKLKQTAVSEFSAINKVEEDRLALEQARREVAALRERLDWHRQSSEATYKIIASKKARAENKVNEIRKGIEGFQVKADRDGVAVYKNKWNGERFQVGETVFSGQSVMEIPDLDSLLAEAFVPEVDIGKVKAGQRAEVLIDAFPGKSYKGVVKGVGTLVRPKSWDIPNKILEAQIAFDELDTSIMRPGMSVKARIEISSIPDCLAVPLRAVRVTAAGARVKLKTEAGWREHPVELGDSNGTDIIVTAGLKPGDRIAGDFSKAN